LRQIKKREKITTKEAPQELTAPVEQGSDTEFIPIPLELALTDQQTNLTSRLIIDFGITAAKAMELVKAYPEQTKAQLDAWPFRKNTAANKAGWIIQAIEQSYSLPEGFIEAQRKATERERQESLRAEINACSFCNESGWRIIKKPH